MKIRNFLICMFIFSIFSNFINADSLPISGSGNTLTINTQCTDNCSGKIFLIKENHNAPFWSNIYRDLDYSGSDSYKMQNIDKGDYLVAIRDNKTKELGWLLDNGSIVYNCPLPVNFYSLSFSDTNVNKTLNININNSITCCQKITFSDSNKENIFLTFNNLDSDNISGKVFIIPDNSIKTIPPIELNFNSKDYSYYLPEGKYYIWGYVNDNGIIKTTDGWKSFEISESENNLNIDFNNNSSTLNIKFEDENFSLKNRWILIFKEDQENNWRLFFSRKVFLGNKDDLTLDFIPTGEYKIGYINSSFDVNFLNNFDLINFYNETGITHELNNSTTVAVDGDTNISFKFNQTYKVGVKILNSFDNIMSVVILSDVFSNGIYVNTFFNNPSLFATATISGIEAGENVELKFIKDNYFKKINLNVTKDDFINVTLDKLSNKISGKVYNNNKPVLNVKMEFFNPISGESIGYTWTDKDGEFLYYFPDDIKGTILGAWINGNLYFIGSDGLISNWKEAKIYYMNNDEISVNIDDNSILNANCFASNIILSENFYDFGAKSLGYKNKFDLTIFNFGSKNIKLDNITFIKNDENVFTIDNNSCSEISPMESCKVTVSFTPKAIKTYNALISVSFLNNGVKFIKFKGSGKEFDVKSVSESLNNRLKDFSDMMNKIEKNEASQQEIDNMTSNINSFIEDFYYATRGVNLLLESGKTIDKDILNQLVEEYSTLMSYVKILRNVSANVDLETLSFVMPFFKNISDELINTNDKDSLENIFNSSVLILEQLNEMTNKATKPEDVKNIITDFDKTVNPGITAAVNSNLAPEQVTNIIDKAGQFVADAIDKSNKIATPNQLSVIINNSAKSLGSMYDNIANLKGKMTEQTKQEVVEKVKNVTEKITQKVVSSVETLPNDKVNEDDVKEIKSGVSQMASNFIRVTDQGMDTKNVDLLKSLSKQLINKISDDLDINAFSAEESIPTAKLVKIINLAGIDITNGILNKANITDLNIDNNTSEQIKNLLPLISSPDKPIFSEDNKSITSKTVLSDIIKKYFKDSDINSDNNDGSVKINVDNFTIPTFISKTSIISSELDGKLIVSPRGNIMLINNGITDELTPAPENAIDFLYTLVNQYGLDNNSLKLNPNGTVSISLDNSTFFCSFSYLINKKPSFTIGTVSFSISGSDPTSQSYMLLVNYPDGTSQQLTPYIYEIDLFDQLIGYLKMNYSIDRSSGIVDITSSAGGEIKLLPDFKLIPLTVDEKSWFEKNQIIPGIALKVEDKNKDGKDDIIIYTANGSQVLYTL